MGFRVCFPSSLQRMAGRGLPEIYTAYVTLLGKACIIVTLSATSDNGAEAGRTMGRRLVARAISEGISQLAFPELSQITAAPADLPVGRLGRQSEVPSATLHKNRLSRNP